MLGRLLVWIVLELVLILTLAAGAAMLSAQQAPADVPSITFRTNTRLVLVDVVVTDKKGQPVAGLKTDDFTLEENGKKQKISLSVPPGSTQQVLQHPPRLGSSPIAQSTWDQRELQPCCSWTRRTLRSKNKPTRARKC